MSETSAPGDSARDETALAVRLLRAFAAAYPSASFVQVGANDGVSHDPLHRLIGTHQWRGVLVEPVPHIFKRLCQTYAGNERLVLENVAIAESEGTRPIYHLPESSLPDEPSSSVLDFVASLDRARVDRTASAFKGGIDLVTSTEVPCLTLDSLIEKHRLERLDLLLIDAEGYDWEILRNADLERLRPRLLIFEQLNLTRSDRLESEVTLRALNYHLVPIGFDTWSLDLVPDDELTRRWRAALEKELAG